MITQYYVNLKDRPHKFGYFNPLSGHFSHLNWFRITVSIQPVVHLKEWFIGKPIRLNNLNVMEIQDLH